MFKRLSIVAGAALMLAASAAHAQQGAPGAGGPGGGAPGGGRGGFGGAALDANGDGKVTLDEFKTARMAAFTNADTDKNDTVTAAEMAAGRGPGAGAPPGGPGAPPPGAPGAGPGGPGGGRGGAGGGLMAADANTDGSVTKAEYTTYLETQFKTADANSDGSLDTTEQGALRGGGRGGAGGFGGGRGPGGGGAPGGGAPRGN